MDITDSEKVKLTDRITQYGKDIDQLRTLYMQIVSEKNGLHREKETLKQKLEKKKDKLQYSEE